MKPLSLNEKTTILSFRGVIFLLLCFFLLYNPQAESAFSWGPYSLVGIYLFSNLALLPIEKAEFSGSILSMAIFLFDTAWISLVIYSSEGIGSDLYLIYFLVVFMSGIQMKIWQSFLIGSVASFLYLSLWAHARPEEGFLDAHTLLRLPFFYLVSFFTAYFAQQVQERESRLKIQYQMKLAKAERRAIAGRLAGKIAFEMNNPLTVVIGFAQSFLKRLSPSDPLHAAALHISQGAARCKEMVESLLLLSDQTWTALDAVDINAVIRDAAAALKEEGTLAEAMVTLSQDLENALPFIRGEPRQLGRAIRELMKNALDAMPEGGTLTLRSRRLRKQGGDEIQCEILDTGKGIEAAAASQLFEPFFTTKEGEGRGLGLSYVSAIAERHRGSVHFDSQAGRGTRFILRMPVDGRRVERTQTASGALTI